MSRHASVELDNDDLDVQDVVDSAAEAEPVEDYTEAQRGPSVLALHRLRDGTPVHVVWAFHEDTAAPAVMVTAYRPDPDRRSDDFKRRRS